MNKSKIEWCDHTLNIITGCNTGCPYCYARTMAKRFAGDPRENLTHTEKYHVGAGRDGTEVYVLDEPFIGENGEQIIYPFGFAPTLHRYRGYLLDNLKRGTNIFVGAMADVFGPWVPDEWIRFVMNTCKDHPLNNYMFLTKWPNRYIASCELLETGDNYFYGATATSENSLNQARVGLEYLAAEVLEKPNTFISFEPLMSDVHPGKHLSAAIGWVIIGAETGRRKDKVVPELEWIKKIVTTCDSLGIPVFMKDSLIPIVGEANMRRDFPEQLKMKPYSKKVAARLFAQCAECKKTARRNEMVTISARVGRDGKGKSLFAMCRSCYERWTKYHKINGYTEELFGEVKDEKEKLQADKR